MDPAPTRVADGAALSFSAGRDRFVVLAAVHEAVARWAAPLPRSRQPDDAHRRAVVACACALSEQLHEAGAGARWDAAERGVGEDVAGLSERSGLTRAQVEPALATLIAAGCVERISAGGQRRVRLLPEFCGEVPALATIAWTAARARLRTVGASILPALAVLRSVARQSGPIPRGGPAPVVACTQEGLAAETLLGRTAVVSALRALGEVGLLERAARRGTWTECRLLPAAYDPAAVADEALGLVGDQEVPLGWAHDRGAGGGTRQTAPVRLAPASPRSPTFAGSPAGAEPLAPAAAPAPHAPAASTPDAPPPMVLDVGGIRVPLAPGMTVEPPPGATITIELDEHGRRFVRLGPGLLLGPLA